MSRLNFLLDDLQVALDERKRLLDLGLKPSGDENHDIEQLFRQLEASELSASQANTFNGLLASLAGSGLRLPHKKTVSNSSSVASSSAVPIAVPAVPDNTDSKSSKSLSKSVRFKDSLVEYEPDSFLEPYRDDPAPAVPSRQDQLQMQREAMQQQDEHLDRLSNSVRRQHELSIQIDDELNQHISIIGDIDRYADVTRDNLDRAKKQLTTFSRKARENGSWLTIAMLIIILVLLLVIV